MHIRLGVFFSREEERRLELDVASRAQVARCIPSLLLRCGFRQWQCEIFCIVFIQAVKFEKHADLFEWWQDSVDSSNARAGARKGRAVSYWRNGREQVGSRVEIGTS